MEKNEIFNSPSLKAFKQHGFKPNKISGRTQVIGQCPFCMKMDKFYVNIQAKKWDCKVCGKNGGFQTWLREIWEFSKKHFKGRIARELVKDRGLGILTLKRAGVGYNPHTMSYILPVWDVQGERIHNLRIYHNHKLLGTHSCSTGLYGWEQITPVKSNIWLCEGHWDALTIRESLHKTSKDTELALAVPGSNIFKSEWTGFLKDCNVNVVYDNDKAGREGCVKIYNNLKGICKKLNFLYWKSSDKEGKDIRDLWINLKKDKGKFYRKINTSLKEEPQITEDVETKITTPKKAEFKWKGKGLTPDEARARFTKWLLLPDPYVIDMLAATYIGNRLDGEPLWLFLVGQSGSGKSELIMAFDEVQNTTAISTLTTKTLISGANFAGGGDPSLIPRLDGRILCIKDLTTLLDMNPQEQKIIWGQLRDAYDGKAAKPFGNGTFRIYESRFGMLVGVTPTIEIHLEGQSALGERFLKWDLPPLRGLMAEEATIRKAMMNTTKEKQMKRELSEAAQAMLNYDFSEVPVIPTEISDKILYISQVAGRLRGTVNRDKYSREVTHTPFQEVATRISKQLLKYITSVAMFRRLDKVTMNEFNVIKHIVLSTANSKMLHTVKSIYNKKDKIWTRDALNKHISISGTTVERVAEDLRMLKILQREGGRYGQKNWILKKEIRSLIDRSEIFVRGKLK